MTPIIKTNRGNFLNQKAKLIWFTGLPCSGKTTLAQSLDANLNSIGFKTYFLDADVVRQGLNKDLGFSRGDRQENIRRIAEVSKILIDAGIIVLAAFISPFQEDRRRVKEVLGDVNYIEIFVDCPLNICEARDVRGLYRKARQGLIKDFTGIDSPYEKPVSPDLIIQTNEMNLEYSVDLLMKMIIPQITR